MRGHAPQVSADCMRNLDVPDQDLGDSECQIQIEQMAEMLLQELRSGSSTRKTRAAATFSRYAFQDKVSSRAAQLALETATAAEQVTLASGLHGHVRSAMLSKNGNYVITKAVEVMPVDRASFIVEELLGHGVEVARHRFGCRVICRILEHLSPRDENSMKLLNEVLEQAENLCNHAFGSIVMRHFLEHGLAEHKHRVALALCTDIVTCAMQRKGSHVVEAAFRHCAPDDHRLLAERILADSTELFGLATGQFGRHVVVTLLGMEGEKEDVRQQLIKALLPMAPELGESKFGKGVCAALSMSTTALGAPASPSRL
jgi:pumilio RNA-binding family